MMTGVGYRVIPARRCREVAGMDTACQMEDLSEELVHGKNVKKSWRRSIIGLYPGINKLQKNLKL